MSLYIRTRCPNCLSLGNYANDSNDSITCDHCLQDFLKIDGMKLDTAPKQSRVRNELRKEIARRKQRE